MLRTSLLSGVAVFLLALIACSKDSDPNAGTTTSSSGSTSSSGGSSNGNNGSTSSSSSTGGTTSGDPPPSADVNVTDESVTVNGENRAYKLVVPKTYDAGKKYPLIVAMHGDDLNAGTFVSYSHLDTAAGKEAVMAFTDQSLNLTDPFDDNVDQKMVPAIVDAVKGSRSIDPTKIWGFGYSKGAYQIAQLLCRGIDVFTAVAVHNGGAPQDADCPNPSIIPMLVVGGELDKDTGSEYYAQVFAGFRGCDAFGDRTKAAPDPCEKFNGCDSNVPLLWCEIKGQPHDPINANAAAMSWAWFKTL